MELSNAIKCGMRSAGISTYGELSKMSGVPLSTIKKYTAKSVMHSPNISNLKKLGAVIDLGEYLSLNVSQYYENMSPISVSQSKNMSPNISISDSPIRFANDSLVSPSQNNLPLIDILANRSQFAELDKYDIINIPFFRDGKVSVGFGEHHIEGDVDYIPYSKSMLKARFNLAPQGILGIITAIGNSMAPTINDGDLLLFQCDGSSNDGGIYIMRLDNDYYVKRLQKRPKIRLISDNPTYEPIELQDLQELEIIGRVVGIISSVRL